MKQKKNNAEIISPEIKKLIDEVMRKQNSASRGHTLIGNKSRIDALTPPTFRNRSAPIKLIDEDYTTERSGAHPQDKLFNKISILTPRLAFVHAEAKKLKRECKDINQVNALKNINFTLKEKGYKPYSRTQFNRIVKGYNFPPARRGRKSTK